MNWNPQDFVRLIYIVVAVIAPMVPAFVLFKYLPARARASGPYTGLKINLEGAFAGYFLLFLATLGFLRFGGSPPDYEHQVWKVSGKVLLEQADSQLDENKLVISTRPNVTLSKEGDFIIYVVVRRERASQDDFPFLIFEYGNEYASRSLNLNKLQTDNEPVITWSRNPLLKEVNIENTIVLKKKPPPEPEQELEPYNPPAENKQ
ncbi:MAG: hypothetical protein LC785_07800 [Acidobacteria bacterium]|nr:hypothetical protein [Acidobacteriota bacterium]MCA1641837.1 hypothetical protein [Acidobacteriota bacterium]